MLGATANGAVMPASSWPNIGRPRGARHACSASAPITSPNMVYAVYKVRVGQYPSCSCPDAAKGNICKHYLYCMIRVLRMRQDDPLVWQKALLAPEAEEVGAGTCALHACPLLHAVL